MPASRARLATRNTSMLRGTAAVAHKYLAANTSMLRGIARLHRVARNTSMLRGIARHPSMRRLQDTRARHLSTTTTPEEEDIDVDAVAYAFMGSKALFAALELGLFDVVARRGNSATLADIEAGVGVDAPRAQTLVTALTALKALRRDAATQTYALSPNAAKFLVADAPAYYGDYLRLQVGSQFYDRMAPLAAVMRGEDAPTYATWFEDPKEAEQYSLAQHNGSVATGRALAKQAERGRLGEALETIVAGDMALLDVGGGSGAFSYVFAERGARATVIELPEVAAAGRAFAGGPGVDDETRARVCFEDLDVTAPAWPVAPATFDVVLMSYVSGSVPEAALRDVYQRAHAALKPGGVAIVHDFMVDDSLDGPRGAALWALQHVAVNADGLGLHPAAVAAKLEGAGFNAVDAPREMIGGMTKLVIAHKA